MDRVRTEIAILVITALLAFAPLLAGQVPPPGDGPTIDRVSVPAGAFLMGVDRGGEADERPRHTLTLPAFRIDRTEVTRGDWMRCVAARRCTRPRPFGARFEDPRAAVVGVSWEQSRAYCAWARGRLPSEREWEKAARGTDGRTYPWGEAAPTAERAVFGLSPGRGAPAPVGERLAGASPYGALDLAGNVWEWTETPYDPFAYRSPTEEPTCARAMASLDALRSMSVRGFTGSNPLPDSCERVLRGGAWNYGAAGLRVTNRVHHGPGYRINVAGLRCADNGV